VWLFRTPVVSTSTCFEGFMSIFRLLLFCFLSLYHQLICIISCRQCLGLNKSKLTKLTWLFLGVFRQKFRRILCYMSQTWPWGVLFRAKIRDTYVFWLGNWTNHGLDFLNWIFRWWVNNIFFFFCHEYLVFNLHLFFWWYTFLNQRSFYLYLLFSLILNLFFTTTWFQHF